MPHIYLAPWVWNQTDLLTGPFWDAPFAQFCQDRIDLRPLPAQAERGIVQGYGLFTYSRQVVIPGSVYLQDSVVRSPSITESNLWKGLLNISDPLEGNTLGDQLWSILTVHADPTGANGVKPLAMEPRGTTLRLGAFGGVHAEPFSRSSPAFAASLAVRWDDYRRMKREGVPLIALQRWNDFDAIRFFGPNYTPADLDRLIPPEYRDDGARPHLSQFNESFNTVNSDTLGPDLTWAETIGGLAIVSNKASCSGESRARAEHDLSSSNHYGQCEITSDTNSRIAGPAVRFSSSADTAYVCEVRDDATTHFNIVKWEAGTRTALKGASPGAWSGAAGTARLEIVGSDLELFFGGVSKVTLNNETAITGNLRTGIARLVGSGTVTFDDFEAADLGAAAATRRHAVMF